MITDREGRTIATLINGSAANQDDLFGMERSSAEIFEVQRSLREMLLDRTNIRYAPARDLAAHMLLNLDDLETCWDLATTWLRDELRCHRVDSGFGMQQAHEYFPGLSEAKSTDIEIPSFGDGRSVDNRDPVMQAMWLQKKPVVLADIKQDSRVSQRLRQRLAGARTKSKFASALRTRSGAYGLICADWTEYHAPWEAGLHDCFEHTVADVLGPIIAASRQYGCRDVVKSERESGVEQSGYFSVTGELANFATLTPTEMGGRPFGRARLELQRDRRHSRKINIDD